MKQVGFSYKLIPSDSDFIKFAIKFNIFLLASLISLWITRGETEFIDIGNFELSKVTFRATMGILALIMASTYWSGIIRCFVSALFNDDSSERIEIEMAMVYGFLTLAFFLMNLLGFFWGIIICLPISPPFLLLCLKFVKRNVKESQE